MQSPRASAAKDRTPPVLGLRTPQATEPRQAHRTSVLTGDPPHPFPELRQHLQVGHDRGLQLQRERLGYCDQRPVCEGQSPAHAPQGGAANRCASLSNTGPQAWVAPAWRHRQDSKRVPPSGLSLGFIEAWSQTSRRERGPGGRGSRESWPGRALLTLRLVPAPPMGKPRELSSSMAPKI